MELSRGTVVAHALLASMVFLGCGGGSSSTPPPGATCAMNSECQQGLTCSFGRCQSVCKAAIDCPTGQTCVKNASGINSCLLPAIAACHYNSECSAPLICGADFSCRNQCQSDRDCATATQKCVLPGGVCAEPSSIAADGTLKPAQSGLDGGVQAGLDAGTAEAGGGVGLNGTIDGGADVAVAADLRGAEASADHALPIADGSRDVPADVAADFGPGIADLAPPATDTSVDCGGQTLTANLKVSAPADLAPLAGIRCLVGSLTISGAEVTSWLWWTRLKVMKPGPLTAPVGIRRYAASPPA